MDPWTRPSRQPSGINNSVTAWRTTLPKDLKSIAPNYLSYSQYPLAADLKNLLEQFKTRKWESFTAEQQRKIQLAGGLMGVRGEAESSLNNSAFAPLNYLHGSSLKPWSHSCRIYFRTLRENAYDSDGNYIADNAVIPFEWGQATAYFVRDVHAGDSKSQYLLTVAHNLITRRAYTCNRLGKIAKSDREKPSMVETDAIMVAAGWGDDPTDVYFGWVDKVSIMSKYIPKNMDDNTNVSRFDGAALRIVGSTIPSDFWKAAPSLAAVTANNIPPVGNDLTISASLCIPGYPGVLNQFKDLAGPYVSGSLNMPGHNTQYADFKVIPLNISSSSSKSTYPGCLEWDEKQCFVAKGQSGSPCLMIGTQNNGPLVAFAVGSLHTVAVGAPFVPAGNYTAVSPAALLEALDIPGARLANLMQTLPHAIRFQ